MADILTRLRLDTSQFDNNLKRSRKQTDDFNNGMKTLATGFAKAAGAIGIGLTAFEGFNKAMESNQTTSDAFHNNLNAAKDSVDSFFKAITTGDWGTFNDGMITTFKNFKELSAIIDDLNDKKLSLTFTNAEDRAEMARFREIAMDTSLPKDQRLGAAEGFKGVVANMAGNIQNVIAADLEALNKEFSTKSGLSINSSDLKTFLRTTNTGAGTNEARNAYEEYIKKQRTVSALSNTTAQTMYGAVQMPRDEKAIANAEADLKNFLQANEYLIKQGWLLNDNDKSRKEMVERLVQQVGLEEQIYNYQRDANKLLDRVNKSENGGSSTQSSISKEFAEGSIGQIKQQIQTYKAALEEATDGAVRSGIQMAIDGLEVQLSRMQTISYTALQPKGVTTNISAKDDKINPFQIVGKKDTKHLNDYNEGLNTTLSMMMAVRNATQDGAAGWITYGVNAVSSMNQTYQALAKVIPALQVKAISEAVGSAAAVPIIGWINAGLAAATMIATFASMPKYESGGFVGGSSYTGDNVLARVNSGELILNVAQHKNVASAFTSGTQKVSVEVTGRVSGKDLAFVMKDNERFNKRTR